MNHALRPLQPYAPDISVIGSDNPVLIDRTLVEQVKALSGAEKVYARMFSYDMPASTPQGDGIVTLISYDEPQFEWAEGTLVSGDTDSVKNGEGVFVAYSEEMGWRVGDMITLNISGKLVDVPIAGILSGTPFVAKDGEWLVICSEDTFTALTGISDYTIIDMQVKEDISEQVRSLLTPELRMLDNQKSNLEVQATYNAMAVFVYGFLVVIALVALINILNTVSASVSNRMNNYGVMRAVGMSSKQLKKMVTAEAAAYAITGCIVGGGLGLILHRFFFENIITLNWGETWQPPFAVLAIIIFAAIITTFVAVISPTRKIKETSIVDVVNAGE